MPRWFALLHRPRRSRRLTFEDEGGEDNRTLVSASSLDEAIALWLSTGDEGHRLEALTSVWELPPIADSRQSIAGSTADGATVMSLS
jgi:hypothetical protein